MLLMSKIARVVYDTDHGFRSGKTASGIDFIGRILTCPKAGFMFVDRRERAVQQKKNFIEMWFAELLVAVEAGIGIDADQIGSLKLADMIGQCTVCDFEPVSQLIHAHFSVLQEQLQDLDADIRTKGLEYFEAF